MKIREMRYKVNGQEVIIKTQDKDYSKNKQYYEKSIITALGKIGVTEEHVEIKSAGRYTDAVATVIWNINGQQFKFECDLYDSQTKNMSAISQAIQDDVRHIRRGIKSLWASMRQYESLPSPETVTVNNPYSSMSLKEIRNLMKIYHPDGSSPDKKKFSKLVHAKEIIENE